MQRFTSALIVALLLTSANACDSTQFREAPDVPWPSVDIDGPMKSPEALVGLLEECFVEVDYDHGQHPRFHYSDQEPDGDDQQHAQLCVEWSAHLDVADCVRRALIDLGGTPTD